MGQNLTYDIISDVWLAWIMHTHPSSAVKSTHRITQIYGWLVWQSDRDFLCVSKYWEIMHTYMKYNYSLVKNKNIPFLQMKWGGGQWAPIIFSCQIGQIMLQIFGINVTKIYNFMLNDLWISCEIGMNEILSQISQIVEFQT